MGIGKEKIVHNTVQANYDIVMFMTRFSSLQLIVAFFVALFISVAATGIYVAYGSGKNVADFFLTERKHANIPQYPVRISGRTIRVEIAKTSEEHARGLSGRARIGDDEGMFFFFSAPSHRLFWMNDMHFPIDIVWVGADATIVDITHVASPESFPKKFASRTPAQHVIEVPAHTAQKYGFRIGDRVDVTGIPH